MLTSPSSPPVVQPALPRVLLVDDDEDDQFFVRQAFVDSGKPCELFSATDGTDCLEFLTETNSLPDLVLLDLNMPLMNGFEVLQHLRTMPRWQNLTVVVLSTSRDEQARQLALKLGAADCLTKPSNYADYRPLVDQFYGLYLK